MLTELKVRTGRYRELVEVTEQVQQIAGSTDPSMPFASSLLTEYNGYSASPSTLLTNTPYGAAAQRLEREHGPHLGL